LNCQPLTSANSGACCAAKNWRQLVRPQDIGQCRRPSQTLSSPRSLGSPPGTNDDSPPPGTVRGRNNGFGNGNQDPPGKSGPHNNAENAHPSRSNPSGSPNSSK
jgi:hypothetical protein